MCLFHKWETIQQRKGTITLSSLLFSTSLERNVVVNIKQCKKCQKKKAEAKTIDGTTYALDIDFMEQYQDLE